MRVARCNTGWMYIRRIFIRNFGCIEEAEIEFSTVTTFLGPNGVGKSTVLRALDWFFNGSAQSLGVEDIFMHNGDAEVSVGVEFHSLTDRDRDALGKYADAGDSATIHKRWQDGAQKLVGRALVFPPFQDIRAQKGAKERGDRYRELQRSCPELELPAWGSDAKGQATMDEWEAANPDRLELNDVEEANHFFGFAGQARMAGLFDYVLVSADLRAAEETTDSKNAAIGRIIEQAISRQKANEQLATLIDRVSRIHAKINARNFDDQLSLLSKQLTEEVAQFAPGRSVGVSASTMPIQPQQVRFEVSILDQELETPVHRQGHGFQRAVLVAALKLLAESRSQASASREGVLCLAIEEPELYQHPLQARSFASVLRSLAENFENNIQVAYATHSPYFVEARSFHQVRRVTRTSGEGFSLSANITGSSVEDLVTSLEGFLDETLVKKNLDAACIGSLSEALFADVVVLVEGGTDRAVLSGVAARDAIDVALDGIVIVEVGGKQGLLLAHAILQSLGIPSVVMADNDSDKQKKLMRLINDPGSDPTKVQSLKRDVERHKTLNAALLRFFGCPMEDWPEGRYGRDLLFVDGCLELFLKDNWPEWMTARDELVQEGIGFGGKDQMTYQDAALRADSEPPIEFLEALSRASELRDVA